MGSRQSKELEGGIEGFEVDVSVGEKVGLLLGVFEGVFDDEVVGAPVGLELGNVVVGGIVLVVIGDVGLWVGIAEGF